MKAIAFSAALALIGSFGQASAAVVLDSDATGGWSNGTGTSNGHFTLDQEADGVEVGLRASIRGGGGGPVTPIGSEYIVPAGSSSNGSALWNFDYTINTGNLTGVTAMLTITNGANVYSFNPLTLIPDNTTNSAGAKQNSENLAFSFLADQLGFNPNASGNYTIDLVLLQGTTNVGQVAIEVAAIPEPSTWAMMLIGFAGITFAGFRSRSRRLAVSLA